MGQEWLQEEPFIKEDENLLLSCSHKRTYNYQQPSIFDALKSLFIYLSFEVFENCGFYIC